MLFILVSCSQSAVNITFSGTTLKIEGQGLLSNDDFEKENIPISIITEAIVGEGITELAPSTFEGFRALAHVSLPDTLQTIGSHMFLSTKIESLHLPIGVASFDVTYSFYDSYKLTSITVNQSNSKYSSFDSCLYNRDFTQLLCVPMTKTSISFHRNINEIKTWAFYQSKISNVIIPDSVLSLDSMAFVDSKNEYFNTSNNCKLTKFPPSCFWNVQFNNFTCPILVSKIGTSAFRSIPMTFFKTPINGNLTYLDNMAFRDCKKLKLIELSKTIEFISSNAFEGCSSLENIVILGQNDHYKTIEGSIFTADEYAVIFIPPSILQVTIPANTSIISSSLLQKCVNIQNIIINESNKVFKEHLGIIYVNSYSKALHSIGSIKTAFIKNQTKILADRLFENHPKLEKIIFESGLNLTDIGSYCFASVKTLSEITFPSSVSKLGSNCFAYSSIISFCTPPLVSEIPYSCFYASWIHNFTYSPGSQLKSIQRSAFKQCKNLTLVRLPDGITKLETMSFYQSSKLDSINLPDSIEELQSNALSSTRIDKLEFSTNSHLQFLGSSCFDSCSSLVSIALPPRLTKIEDKCFNGCSKLTIIIFLSKSSLISIDELAFANTNISSFHLPGSLQELSVNTFKNCKYLFAFIASSDNGNYSTFNNVLYNKDGSILELFPPNLNICKICSSCSSIAPNAFADASKLKIVDFGSDSILQIIDDNTFSGCFSLSIIQIPKSVKHIGSLAFNNCINLKSFIIEEHSNLISLGYLPFNSCCNVVTISLEYSTLITRIYECTFQNLIKLQNIKLPSNINSISGSLFSNCTSLTTLVIPNSVSDICSLAFNYCLNLFNITLPSSLTIISSDAFSCCNNISYVYYCGNTQFTNGIFSSSCAKKITILTLSSYQFKTIFGIECIRIMHRCYVFPTNVFTANIYRNKVWPAIVYVAATELVEE